MRVNPTTTAVLTLLTLAGPVCFADVGSPFCGDAPDDHHPWAIHDRNRPQPPLVTPGTFSSQAQPGQPPSDAVILFDGTDLSQWEAAKKVEVKHLRDVCAYLARFGVIPEDATQKVQIEQIIKDQNWDKPQPSADGH